MAENALLIFVGVLAVCCIFIGVLQIVTGQDGKE